MELIELESGFAKRVVDYLNEVFDEKKKDFQDGFEKAVKKANQVQEEEQTVPIEHITVQFSETDYYFGKAIFQVIFYEPQKLFQQAFLTENIAVDWLIKPLEDLSVEIRAYQTKEMKMEEWYQLEIRKMLRILLKTASYFFKYAIRDCCENGCVEGLFHIENLSVSIGQQLNWQLPVYQCGPMIDLIGDNADVSRRFRIYRNGAYQKKKIAKMDFTGSIFEKCIFDECEFEENIWNDVLFKDCEFKNSSFQRDQVLGVSFKQCSIRNTTVKDIVDKQASTECVGLFQNMRFEGCNEEFVATFMIEEKKTSVK